jgi:hypothetical protein
MNTTNFKTCLFMIGLTVILQACSTATPTEVLHILEPITPTPVVQPVMTEAAETTLPPTEAAIQHTTIPVNLPEGEGDQASDFDSSKVSLVKPVIGGDRFTNGQLERPFNANTIDVYIPSLDIVNADVFQDDLWIYGEIRVMGRETDPALTRRYGLEFDLDHDGKGDWLITASNPSSTDWTVAGVQVYQDANGDVGSASAMYTDKNVAIGDGFETLVFDQGAQGDPDMAWARTSPADPNTVEISIKRSALGDPESYLISMWAGSSLLDPALFDLNDYFTYEQAGAADPSYAYYPIKEVAEIDNTCRIAVGFQTGKEAGLCQTVIPAAADHNQSGSGTGTEGSVGGGGGGSGGGGEGGGTCPPCPVGYSQYPYPDCSCYDPS